MINVRIKETGVGRLSLDIDGHAGASEVGQDIVCSAATILAYTIAQLVTDYYKSGMLQKKPKIFLENGKASVSCIPKSDYHDYIKLSYTVIQTGLMLLAHNYPQYVTVRYKL